MTALQHITYILVRGASSVAFTSLTLVLSLTSHVKRNCFIAIVTGIPNRFLFFSYIYIMKLQRVQDTWKINKCINQHYFFYSDYQT